MKLARFKVKHYRSYRDEQEIVFANTNVLIGPDNAGKSNFLQAIELFFLTFEGDQTLQAYKHDRDLPTGLASGRTSLTAVFQFDGADKDDEILSEYESQRQKLNLPVIETKGIRINLQFSEKNMPVYSIVFETRIPQPWKISDDFHSRQQDLIEKILRRFCVTYMPAGRELKQLPAKNIVEVVKQEIADQIKVFVDEVGYQPQFVSQELNRILSIIGMSGINVFFEPPVSSVEQATKFDNAFIDRSLGSLFENGVGMRWQMIASCVSWVSLSIKKRTGLRCIWLIEEPESYLHPESFSKHRAACKRIGDNADMIYTTHSQGFVSPDLSHVNRVFLKDGQSTIMNFRTYEEAYLQIQSRQPSISSLTSPPVN
jgi:predicted ATP-dependent endonuclease of OLD family